MFAWTKVTHLVKQLSSIGVIASTAGAEIQVDAALEGDGDDYYWDNEDEEIGNE
jgi:hypothetical protein